MVKNYIVVASVLLGSMLAGHAHAVTAPHATKRKLLNDEAEILVEEAAASEFSAADFSGELEMSPVYEDVFPTLPVDEDSYSLDTYTVRDTGLAPIDFATGKR